MTRTEFFNLLNADLLEGVEPLDKDQPFFLDGTDAYLRRFAEFGLEVTDYEPCDEDAELSF